MSDWKESLVDYFNDGIKEGDHAILGVEIEHFILDQNMKAVPYAGEKGIHRILSDLMAVHPEAKSIREDALLGFITPDYDVTLEPAAQLEISIRPLEDISRIKEIYSDFRKDLTHVLSDYDYRLANIGCQPVSKVADLELIPKQRYELMNAYFNSIGTGGMEMMRGTASMQISIDYHSEVDFRRKLQAAYYYGPMIKLLTDNTCSFQGKVVNKKLMRTDIWRRVDSNRCHPMPGLFSENFGFFDYADFIGDLRPIFLKKKETYVPTDHRRISELYQDRALSEEEIAHALSMSFPDVRLKHVLEIRFADSLTFPYMEAYCALIKGLMYSEEGLSFAEEKIRQTGFSEKDLLKTEDALMASGWSAEVYGKPAEDAARELIALAGQGLSVAEVAYLTPFEEVIAQGGITKVTEGNSRKLFCA